MAELAAGERTAARGPFRIGGEQDRGRSIHRACPLHARVGQALQHSAQITYLAEHRRIWARVRHHSGVERLRTGARLSPLEEVDGVRAHRHMGQSVADHLAVAFARVDRLPLYGGRGMLHQIPRVVAGEPADQRIGAGQLVQMGFSGHEIVVVGHEIDLGGPVGVVERALVGGDHEVRGKWLVRANSLDDVALRHVEPLERVRTETRVIQLLGGVDHRIGAHVAGHVDLVEAADLLRPERGAPRLVHRLRRAVPGLAPALERAYGVVGIVHRVVPAVFVAHVPGGHVGVVLVPFGELAAQGQRVLTEHRAGRPP